MQHLQPNTTLQGGKYRIEDKLGQGGFGITYLATQVSSNRQVAIKELFIGGSGQAINDRRGNQVVVTNSANQASFDQQKEKFKKEAERLANLNHPNLVKVHELFEENGTAYYVMDYIDGESLRTKLNREGALPEDLVLNYLQQLLPALEVAHKKSIWHLDIKPENIMVDKHGHVYLIDFGASKHIEQNNTLTTSLVLAYTKGYCPPELTDLIFETQEDLIDALKEIGPWTDFYALGATIYNLLTDNIPPSSKRIEKNGSSAFTFPSNVSSSTQDLIVWMMEPDREDRPQEVCDVQSEIESEDDERTISVDATNGNDKLEERYSIEARQIAEECSPYWLFFAPPLVVCIGLLYLVWFDSDALVLILLSLYIGVPISLFIGNLMYISVKKHRIEKWKSKHPDNPRCVYLPDIFRYDYKNYEGLYSYSISWLMLIIAARALYTLNFVIFFSILLVWACIVFMGKIR